MPAVNYQRKARNTSAPAVGTKLKRPDVYVCSRCKSLFNKNEHQKEFLTVKSNLFEANDYKVHLCDDCVDWLFGYYLKTFGDAKSAVRRLCMKLDAYYNEQIATEIIGNPQAVSVMRAYMTKINTSTNKMKTYDTTIEEERGNYLYGDYVFEFEDENGNIINPKAEYAKFKEEKDAFDAQIAAEREAFEKQKEDFEQQKIAEMSIDPELQVKFGLGFEPEEYPIMEKQFDAFIQEIPEQCVQTLRESVLDMCRFKAMQVRAIGEKDDKTIGQYSDLFQKTKKYVDDYVKTFIKENKKNKEDIILGSVIETIENFCPADVYKKRDLFDDVDGIKEYFTRFIVRPFKNFFTGSREMDAEYSVKGDEDE